MKLYLTLICMIIALGASAQSAIISVDEIKDLPKDQQIQEYESAKETYYQAVATFGENSPQATKLKTQINDLQAYNQQQKGAQSSVAVERQKYYDAVQEFGKDSKEAELIKEEMIKKIKAVQTKNLNQ